MKVVLLERLGSRGNIGDVVDVKAGHARNWLLPQGKALRATKENIRYFEAQREEIEKRNAERREEAERAAADFENLQLVMIRQAGRTGQLYGSVSTRDIAEALTEQGKTVSRSQVQLNRAIKSLGLYKVQITLHPEVILNIEVNVARSMDEAERQAAGLAPVEPGEEEAAAPAGEEATEGDEAIELEAVDADALLEGTETKESADTTAG
jgi:large subunit ribosomal protein L9